ncbi:MAG: MOP flippase family protein [Steroidobacter sp.]
MTVIYGMVLKFKAYDAVRWTAIVSITKALLQFLQVVILTRLLAPSDYGLMAIVSIVLLFSNYFADLGINSAYVQKQDVTDAQRASLFWLNTALGLGLTLFLIGLSPLLALFFNNSKLTLLLISSATTIFVNSLGQQIRLTAEKSLEFGRVMQVEIAATFSGFTVAVSMAYAGLGVYALVGGGITTAFVGTTLLWIFVANGWRPILRFNIDDIRPFVGFGGAVVGHSIANQINVSVDILLGGRMLPISQLGMYSVARTLILQIQAVINPIITRVGFPLIAQVQNDCNRVKTIYLQSLNMISSINGPLYVGMAMFSPDIEHLVFGGKWLGVEAFLRIFAIWGFLRSVRNSTGSLLFGMGRADIALRWNAYSLFAIPPILWLASFYGAVMLAWSLLLLEILMFIPGWYWLVRPLCNASLIEFSWVALRPLLISGVCVGMSYAASTYFNDVIIRMIFGMVLASIFYVAISVKVNRQWVVALMTLLGMNVDR